MRNYSAHNGMEIVEEFTDEGYSGARLDRPALDRMRDLAERRGFDGVLTHCADRLARKFVLQALILEEMERFGVKTISWREVRPTIRSRSLRTKSPEP